MNWGANRLIVEYLICMRPYNLDRTPEERVTPAHQQRQTDTPAYLLDTHILVSTPPHPSHPAHDRPCWRWMSLLAPGMRSSCTIPVTVYLGPVASRRGDSSGDIPERVDGGDPIASPSAGEASTMNAGCFLARDTTKSSALDQTLLWAFSQAEETRPFARSTREERERTRENGDACSRKSVCGGVLTDREGTIRSTCETKARFCCDVNNPNGSPPAHTQEQCTDCPSLRGSPPSHQDMLRTELIRGEEDLLRASRAICEGGRRDGGSREGICNRDKAFKYPVALLKVWARERPSDDQNHVRRTISSRRRLRVVSPHEEKVKEFLKTFLWGWRFTWGGSGSRVVAKVCRQLYRSIAGVDVTVSHVVVSQISVGRVKHESVSAVRRLRGVKV